MKAVNRQALTALTSLYDSLAVLANSALLSRLFRRVCVAAESIFTCLSLIISVAGVRFVMVAGAALTCQSAAGSTPEYIPHSESRLMSDQFYAGDSAPQTRSIAIAGDSKRWVDGLVPYTIDPELPLGSLDTVQAAIDRWNAVAGITLVPQAQLFDDFPESEPIQDSLRFVSGEYCASWVGRRGGEQKLWVAGHCSTGSVMHEIGHALGLEHEHTRPDRDQYIRIHWENIQQDKQHNFDVADDNARMDVPYDYASIMHYGRYNFSKNGQPTLSARHGGELNMGQRMELSEGDLEAIAALYGTDLSMTTQLLADTLRVMVTNLTSQGAHDITVNIHSQVSGVAATLDSPLLNDVWQCHSLSSAHAQCRLSRLAGHSQAVLSLPLPEGGDAESLQVSLKARTPDSNPANNQQTLRVLDNVLSDSGVTAGVDQPLQDGTAIVSVGGGATGLLTLSGFFILILVGRARNLRDRKTPV